MSRENIIIHLKFEDVSLDALQTYIINADFESHHRFVSILIPEGHFFKSYKGVFM